MLDSAIIPASQRGQEPPPAVDPTYRVWTSGGGNREKAAITVDGSLDVCVKILFEEEEAEEKELGRNSIYT
jgi:hypothetical protein